MLTPGRYVGAEEVEDDDEAFVEKMQVLTEKLGDQMAKGAELDQLIRQKLGGWGMSSNLRSLWDSAGGRVLEEWKWYLWNPFSAIARALLLASCTLGQILRRCPTSKGWRYQRWHNPDLPNISHFEQCKQ